MDMLVKNTTLELWQHTIKDAEDRCDIQLNQRLEAYLISLLIRYSDRPELAQQIFAETFLEALTKQEAEKTLRLQNIGDQCLIFAGLFPNIADHRNVKLAYFVDLGRSAYANVSKTMNDFYWTLARQFVALMDVLQSIRVTEHLLPQQALQQWEELGSKRALNDLKSYSNIVPFKHIKGL